MYEQSRSRGRFSPVEQVIQIGGPKGVARLLQRAGRCGHQPGAVSRVYCVPTQAMELVEYAAAREAMEARKIEGKTTPCSARSTSPTLDNFGTQAVLIKKRHCGKFEQPGHTEICQMRSGVDA